MNAGAGRVLRGYAPAKRADCIEVQIRSYGIGRQLKVL